MSGIPDYGDINNQGSHAIAQCIFLKHELNKTATTVNNIISVSPGLLFSAEHHIDDMDHAVRGTVVHLYHIASTKSKNRQKKVCHK